MTPLLLIKCLEVDDFLPTWFETRALYADEIESLYVITEYIYILTID